MLLKFTSGSVNLIDGFRDFLMRNKTLLILSSALITGMSLRFYNLMYFSHMTADECVYTQAVFAMTKGYLPYRDIFIAHPLVHFLIEYPFIRVYPNLLMARSTSVILSFGTLLLVFYIAKSLYSSNVAMFATGFFALSPYAIYYNKLAIVDNTALFFTMLLFYYFFKYYKGGNIKYLLLSGFFAGVAFLSKYTVVFMMVALMFFIAVKSLKKLIFFIVSASIVPSAFFLLLFLTGIHHQWYVQTVSLQLIRLSYPLSLKMWEFGIYLAWILPLFILAIPAMYYRKTKEDTLLTLLYIFPFLIILGKVFSAYYLLILTPILCILATRGLDHYFTRPKESTKRKVLVIILMIFLVHFIISSTMFMGSPQTESAVRSKIVAADYIRGITEEGDKIWTTEADISFFAQRLIVAPNSTIWRYQGFYEDVWGYIRIQYVGQFAGYHGGLITLNDIQEALENEKPKVVVIMKNKLTDMFIWDGIDNPDYKEEGLASYILANYYLDNNFHNGAIEIYVRR